MRDDVAIPDTGDLRADVSDYMEQVTIGLNRMRRAGRPDDEADPPAGLVAQPTALLPAPRHR
jgi:hypothetical protein